MAATAQLEETRRANAITLRAWLLVESVDTTMKLALVSSRACCVTCGTYGKIPATRYCTHSIRGGTEGYQDPATAAGTSSGRTL